MLEALLFFILAATTLIVLAWTGLQLLQPQEDALSERLEVLQASAMVNTTRASKRRFGGGFLNSFVYYVSLIPGMDDYLHETERELAEAGIRNKAALARYVLGHMLFLVTMLVGMLYLQRDNPPTQRLVATFTALILGYLLPAQVLHKLVKRYRNKLQTALPDTVDLLGIVLGTGLALDQAMMRVSEEMQFIYPELAAEFSTVVMQVKAGQDRSKAFQQLVRRTGIEDIKSLAAMIVQSERFGTSLSSALAAYADDLRKRRRRRAETQVAKAGVKMLFPIVLFILPALFVITLGPGLLSVMRDLKGGIGAK